jgi:ADP-heptose:LPS heptosyltransferase
LACSGDSRHARDGERSVPLSLFASLMTLPDTAFVLVQPDIRETDRAAFEAFDDIRCPAAALTDYADTAALLSCLDLLISVDTATAHLAGAMDLPVWTLLPFCPDHRWLLVRGDTPWYPSMRLYRQAAPRDWDSVIRRVRDDLNVGSPPTP